MWIYHLLQILNLMINITMSHVNYATFRYNLVARRPLP